MSDDGPVLIFDSGIGGLTVLREARMLMPERRFVYIADNAAFPYGDWEEEALLDHLLRLFGQLLEEIRPACVIIACNTAFTLAGAALRDFELVLAGHPPMGASDPTPASALAEPTVKMVLPAGKDGKPSLPPMAEETLPVAGPAPIAPQPLAPAGGSSPGTGRVLLWLLLALVVMGAAAAGIALALRKAAA